MGLVVLLDVVHSHISSNADDGLAGFDIGQSAADGYFNTGAGAPSQRHPLSAILNSCCLDAALLCCSRRAADCTLRCRRRGWLPPPVGQPAVQLCQLGGGHMALPSCLGFYRQVTP